MASNRSHKDAKRSAVTETTAADVFEPGSIMYRPSHFKVDDVPRLHGLMRAHPFATLLSEAPLSATHLPTVTKSEGPLGTVECHFARANPHWRDLAAGKEVLIIFGGPQAYIAPAWYPSKQRHGKVLPTWNYSVVHAYGRPELREETDWLRHHLTELTAQQEAGRPQPWTLADSPTEFIDTMLRAIVGFRIELTRLEGKVKMSQNREEEDRKGIEQGLIDRNEGDDAEVAGLVRG